MNEMIKELESKLRDKDTNFLKRQYASRLLSLDGMKKYEDADTVKLLMELGAIYNILTKRGINVPVNSMDFAKKAIKGLSKENLD